MNIIAFLIQQIKSLAKTIKKKVKLDKAFEQLMTVPGIDFILAMTICRKSAISAVLQKSAILLPIAAVCHHSDYRMANPKAVVTVKTAIGISAGHLWKPPNWGADTVSDLAATMIARRRKPIRSWLPRR